jgi:hypothetical protein
MRATKPQVNRFPHMERNEGQYRRRATLHQRPQVRAIVGGSEQFSKTDWSDRPASIASGNSEAGMNASPFWSPPTYPKWHLRAEWHHVRAIPLMLRVS